MCGYEHIYIIDSTLAIVALRAMLDLGEQLRSQGMSAPDIAAQIEAAKSRMRVFGIVDTWNTSTKAGACPPPWPWWAACCGSSPSSP